MRIRTFRPHFRSQPNRLTIDEMKSKEKAFKIKQPQQLNYEERK